MWQSNDFHIAMTKVRGQMQTRPCRNTECLNIENVDSRKLIGWDIKDSKTEISHPPRWIAYQQGYLGGVYAWYQA